MVHVGEPVQGGGGADPRVVGIMAVTQGMHVRAIQVDPFAH